MQKKTYLLCALLIVASLLLSAAIPFSAPKIKLTIYNRTWGKVYVRFKGLYDPHYYYYFRIKRGIYTYSIRADDYRVTFWGCSEQRVTKKMSVSAPFRMTITCNQVNNEGENGMIKVILYNPGGDEIK